MNGCKKIFIIIVLLINLIECQNLVHGQSDTAIIPFQGSSSITVGSWEPWLTDLKFYLYATYVTEGSSTIYWNNENGLLSPNEGTELTLKLQTVTYNPYILIEVEGYKKSNNQKILDKTVEIPIPSVPLPGQIQTPKISAPLIPLEILGIPAELSLQARFILNTEYEVEITATKLEPSKMTYTFSSSTTQTHTFIKNLEIGSQFILSKTGVTTEGSITISAGLSISNIPTPLSVDFSSIPLSSYEYFTHNKLLCNIQTPVHIIIQNIPSVINQDNFLMIKGYTEPKIKNGQLYLEIGGINKKTINTNNLGNFETQWKFDTPGTYLISIKAPDSSFIKESYTEPKSIRVNEKPIATFNINRPRVKIGEEIIFTDQSRDNDGTIVQWAWNFGDEQISNQRNPRYTYDQAGSYDIILRVTDNDGAQSEYIYSDLIIEKISLDIQISASSNSIELGGTVYISGNIYPEKNNLNLNLVFIDPSGLKINNEFIAYSSSYSKELSLTKEGYWDITVLFNGNSECYPTESNKIKINVIKPITTSQTPSEKSNSSKSGGIPGFPYSAIIISLFVFISLKNTLKNQHNLIR